VHHDQLEALSASLSDPAASESDGPGAQINSVRLSGEQRRPRARAGARALPSHWHFSRSSCAFNHDHESSRRPGGAAGLGNRHWHVTTWQLDAAGHRSHNSRGHNYAMQCIKPLDLEFKLIYDIRVYHAHHRDDHHIQDITVTVTVQVPMQCEH
jgi:hypothetical protein